MGKKLLLFFIFLYSFANASLIYNHNYDKELDIVKSFDIDPAFLNDTQLQKTLKSYKKKYRKKSFIRAMKNSYIFLPTVKNMIAQSKLPREFLYLAMAESNFSARAYSNRRAAGLWQFIPATGKHYKLKINEYVDERRDIVKSTEAAIAYLESLHKQFGKWYLAAFAYNCGEGRVARAIRRAKSDDLFVLLSERKKYLPRESRQYIRKIIALAILAHDEEFLSEFDYLLNRGMGNSLVTIELPRGEKLSRVAKMLRMKVGELQALNRHLKYDFIPPFQKRYEIYIPYMKLALFKERYQPQPAHKIYQVYRVKSGDTLGQIGRRHGISYKVIKDFNNLKSNFLSINQKLIIPVSVKKFKTNKKKAKKSRVRYYKVRSGDTLKGIARKFKTNIKTLMRNNKLSSSLIRVGDNLVVRN